MADGGVKQAGEIGSALRWAGRLARPRRDDDRPDIYLRYRAERSLEAVLQAIGSDPSIRQTLQP